MIDEGYYWAKPVGGSLTTSGSNNTPTFAVQFELDGSGEKRTAFLFASDGAWSYTEEKLRRMGWNGDPDQMGFTADRVELQCRHEEYGGKTKEKWDLAKKQSEYQPPADDVKRQILARWKAGAPKVKPKSDAAPSRASTAPSSNPVAAPARSAPARSTPAHTPTLKPKEKASNENEAWGVFFRQCMEINPKREQKSIEEEFDEAIKTVAKDRDKKVLTEADWTEIANSAIPF